MSASDAMIAEFADPVTGAWCCGTAKRGYRTAWERERCYPETTRHRARDYGADIRVWPGEYIVTVWEDGDVPVDVWAVDDAGQVRHVATVNSAGVKAAVEKDSGVASRKNLPIAPGRFTETLPVGAAFVDATGRLDIHRIVSRGKKRVVFVDIGLEDLKPGEVLHAPSHGDFYAVLAARPAGNCENDRPRRRLTDAEKAKIPAGVTLLEYPDDRS